MNMSMPWLLALAGLLGFALESSLGQTPTVRAYLPNMADEDWSFLKDPSTRTDFWDPLKYIPLGGEDRFLTLSGEIRFSPARFRVHGDDETPSLADGYLLQRYLFGADFHLSQRFRIFAELQSGLINGRINTPRPTDRNTLDLHQAFIEWREGRGKEREFSAKLGRQELTLGSSRLISASPGLNVKRSFDGVVINYKRPSWHLAGAVAKLVSLSSGFFDDRPDHQQTFWGFAASRTRFMSPRGEIGSYYLGVDQLGAAYVQGIGRDQRHSVGVKWTAIASRVDFNYDAIFQWGSFSGAPVRAWAFASETGLRFAKTPWRPRFSIRADVASGDQDRNDPALQSFNPLFPGSSYAGAVGLFGPTNLTDVNPSVTFIPHRRIVLIVECPSYWRTSLEDGMYNTLRRVLLPPAVGEGRYVGSNPGVVVVWQATAHLRVQGAVTRFLAGGFLERTFVRNGFGFFSLAATYRF